MLTEAWHSFKNVYIIHESECFFDCPKCFFVCFFLSLFLYNTEYGYTQFKYLVSDRMQHSSTCSYYIYAFVSDCCFCFCHYHVVILSLTVPGTLWDFYKLFINMINKNEPKERFKFFCLADTAKYPFAIWCLFPSFVVPAGSPLCGRNVAVYVFDINQPSVPTPFNSVLVSLSVFKALSTIVHSVNSPNSFPLSHSALPVLVLPYWPIQLCI